MTSSTSDSTSTNAGLSFADPRAAQRARDAIRKISENQVVTLGSNPNVGRVLSVDLASLTAAVWLPGDDEPIQVNLFPGSIPLDLGDFRTTVAYDTSTIGTGGLVYIENFRGKPYITRILSGGEYQLNANVAGMTHRMISANYQNTISGPPIAPFDIFERHVNVLIGADAGFVTGNSLLVGPWSGRNDGSSIDGVIELVLSFYVSSDTKNQVRKYQFSVSDRMIVDLEGDEGNKPFWMRLLPETNLGTNPHAELAVDVALVKTGIRTNLEFWFRLVPLDTLADQSVYFMSVKTFGSAFNVGDPRTGRLVLIKETTAAPVQGWVGFHNAGLGWTERDEYATYPFGSYYQNDEWSSGSWRSGALRAANDLRWTWGALGQWVWTTDKKLVMENGITFRGIGPNWNALHNGYITVPVPTNIAIFPSNNASFPTQIRDVTAGILLNEGETLYYGLCPGSGTGGQGAWHELKNLFFIVDSKTYNATQHNFSLPEWAIPIASREVTLNTERREIVICSNAVDLDDRNTYSEAVFTSAHAGIVGSDETETMQMGSFRYKKKTAYRVKIRCGFFSSTLTQTVNFRLRKGTTTAGALITESFRVPIVNSAGAMMFDYETFFVNDTTSDIVTELVVTGQSNAAAANTWTRYGNSIDPAIVRVDAIGASAKYANWCKLT